MITFKVKTDFDLDKTVSRIIREVSDDLTKELRSRTPIDTGNARRGWKNRPGRKQATISNKVDYITYADEDGIGLEEGLSKQAPRGFVKQSINKVKKNARSGKYKQRSNR